MKKLILSICLMMVIMQAYSQTFAFDSIPDNLRKRADAVIRTEQCLYTIYKPGNATEKYKCAITLLNDESKPYRYVSINYNKNSKVRNIKGTIYDEKGEIIKTLGLSDVFDESAISGGSFYSDDRVKTLYFPIYRYPYTIEYEYEKEYTSLLSYPAWSFHSNPETSVEKSGIQFVVPHNMKLRYFTKNTSNPVDSIVTEDFTTYTWQEENIPVAFRQDISVPAVYRHPFVYAAPLDFEYGAMKGSMKSWKSLGEWIYNLNSGRDQLPEAEIEAVKQLTAKTTDLRQKTKQIYEYMQSKTRYVSIQIGIGGLQPAEAKSVSENGFGDCKALVNYTMALLKVAGIKSYYTLVRSGDDGTVYRNFVSNQFNHIILCVPIEKDTVWLECTNQTLPFNYLGDFTDDRFVLLITEEGGKIVKTPSFPKKENIDEKTGLMFMTTLGTASGTINNRYSGYNYGNASGLYGMQSEAELKRYVSSTMRFSSIAVTAVKYSEDKYEKPTAIFSNTLTINDFAIVLGKKIYFTPAIRKLPFIQDFPQLLEIEESEIIKDSISYYLPTGYKIEHIPENVILENSLVKYVYNLSLINDKLTCKRRFEVNKGVITVGKFNEFRELLNKAAMKDREQIILVKSES